MELQVKINGQWYDYIRDQASLVYQADNIEEARVKFKNNKKWKYLKNKKES